jgi:hypothetical protein
LTKAVHSVRGTGVRAGRHAGQVRQLVERLQGCAGLEVERALVTGGVVCPADAAAFVANVPGLARGVASFVLKQRVC